MIRITHIKMMSISPDQFIDSLKRNLLRNWLQILVWLCLTILVLFLHIKLTPYAAEDDAYIHFRIAQHLAVNGYPYFNLGEPVMSSSSPFWTLLLSLIFKLFPDNLLLVSILNGLSTSGGAIIYTRLLQNLTGKSQKPLFYSFFSLVYVAILMKPSLGMMETPLAMLILGAALLFLYEKRSLCFLFFGIATFTRLELVVFLIAAMIYTVVFRGYNQRTSIFWLIAGTMPFVIYDFIFWGALLPNTMRAKQLVYTLSYVGAFAQTILSFFPEFPILKMGTSPAILIRYGISSIAATALFLVTMRTARLKNSRDSSTNFVNMILACSLLIIAAYTYKRVLIFSWYIPLYSIPIVFAFFFALSRLNSPASAWLFAPVISFWIVGPLIWLTSLVPPAIFNRPADLSGFENGARVREYLEVGKILSQQYPQARVMTSEIGGLGYRFGGYILDGAGLVSPQALQFHPMKVPEERPFNIIGAIPEKFIELTNPEIVAGYDVFVTSFMGSEFKKNYVWITLPMFTDQDLRIAPGMHPWFGDHFNLFIRNDVYQAHPFDGIVTGKYSPIAP